MISKTLLKKTFFVFIAIFASWTSTSLATDEPLFDMEWVRPEDADRVFRGQFAHHSSLSVVIRPMHYFGLFENPRPNTATFDGARTPEGSVRPWMTPAKHQKKRKTCSVFAANALLEHATQRILSEQWLAKMSGTLDSGYVAQRIRWAVGNRDSSWQLEEDCPYHAFEDERELTPNLSKNWDFHDVRGTIHTFSQNTPTIMDDIKKTIIKGLPIAVAVYTPGKWWFQESNFEILQVPPDNEIEQWRRISCKDNKCSSHAIVITGFNEFEQAFEFKNSWHDEMNSPWKDHGYGKMSYDYFSRFHTANNAVAFELWCGPPKNWRKAALFELNDLTWLEANRVADYFNRGSCTFFNGHELYPHTDRHICGYYQMREGFVDWFQTKPADYWKIGSSFRDLPSSIRDASWVAHQICQTHGYVSGMFTGYHSSTRQDIKCFKHDAAVLVRDSSKNWHEIFEKGWDQVARSSDKVCIQHGFRTGFYTGYLVNGIAEFACIHNHAVDWYNMSAQRMLHAPDIKQRLYSGRCKCGEMH